MIRRAIHGVGTAVAVIAFAVAATPAVAGQVAYDGQTVTYTAGPGESNSVLASVGSYDTTCAPVPTPCLTLHESYAHITLASAACALTYSGLGGETAACPVPQALRADLGDGDDAWWDWDGPSTVDGGAGNDNPMFGQAGDDVIRGGSGNDVLFGEAGNDTLDGGTGDDYLEGIPGGVQTGLDTTGADAYIGGDGADALTYERRSEDLSLSPDDVADDGAPGEGDNVGADVETIVAGNGNDRLTGNARSNTLSGSTGDDVLIGGDGDDGLYGGTGADTLEGDAGTDFLEGDDGDDRLTGGADVDTFYGEAALYSYTGRDTIDSRDGNAENVHCGGGIDTAKVDRTDFITGNWWGLDDQCENVDAGPAGPAGGSGAALAVLGLKLNRARRLVVRLSFPAAGTASVTATARLGRRTGRVAKGRATVRAAGPLTLTLKPTRSARRALRRPRGLRTTLRVAFTPTGGSPETARGTFTVRR